MKPNLDSDEAPVNAKTCLCLFINHSPLAAAEWTWSFLPLGEPPGKKQFVNGSSAFKPFKCDVVETDNSITLFASSLQSLLYAFDRKAGPLVFMQQRGCWEGNGSLTRRTKLTAHCCFSGSVVHKPCWEYSSLRCSVIDPLHLLLMLDVTPAHPVSHWQHQLTASIIYHFLSACTRNKCAFKAAALRSRCFPDSMSRSRPARVGIVIRVFCYRLVVFPVCCRC